MDVWSGRIDPELDPQRAPLGELAFERALGQAVDRVSGQPDCRLAGVHAGDWGRGRSTVRTSGSIRGNARLSRPTGPLAATSRLHGRSGRRARGRPLIRSTRDRMIDDVDIPTQADTPPAPPPL